MPIPILATQSLCWVIICHLYFFRDISCALTHTPCPNAETALNTIYTRNSFLLYVHCVFKEKVSWRKWMAFFPPFFLVLSISESLLWKNAGSDSLLSMEWIENYQTVLIISIWHTLSALNWVRKYFTMVLFREVLFWICFKYTGDIWPWSEFKNLVNNKSSISLIFVYLVLSSESILGTSF